MDKRLLALILGMLFLVNKGWTQVEYLGAGEIGNIKVFTSSDYSPYPWQQSADGIKTINGDGLDAKMMEASRFLSQATMGADLELIEEVAEKGIEKWLDEQLELPAIKYLVETDRIHDEMYQWHLAQGGSPDDFNTQTTWLEFMYAWWSENMFNQDLVRQRVALALSEILVVSIRGDFNFFGRGIASYYDLLSKNALGNYKDLLMDVSLHPMMGLFLSHLNNPRELPEYNIHPDENFAREIMQLFSIGLFELNQDASNKLDVLGNPIPSYTNDDIKEMAKIFTGLGAGAVIENEWVDDPAFNLNVYLTDMTVPMRMYEEWHQPGSKTLLNAYVIPADQTGMKDIEDAIDHLFHHPNVGPFIGKQLIQRLVKSNPSPEYIERVAAVFNDNGQGVRGDLKALVKAILMDAEARECEWMLHPENGKLREPMLRYMHAIRAMEKDQANGRFWNASYTFYEHTGQIPLAAPGVFNFFLPYYTPNGPISDAGLIAPEFQIHDARTSVGYMNSVFYWTMYDALFENFNLNDSYGHFDFYKLEPLARDNEVLLNRLDILFTHGQLSHETREIIKEAINNLYLSEYKENRVRLALYLMLISPDFAIFK